MYRAAPFGSVLGAPVTTPNRRLCVGCVWPGVTVLLGATLAASCGSPPAHTSDTSNAEVGAADAGEWLTLFDGERTDHWRGFGREDFPDDGWTVEDGALMPRPDGTVVDIVTRETFRDFELELQWRVAPNGNSGIFVGVAEGHPEVWHTGVEVQVLDNERHPDGGTPETSAGSIYGLVAPDGVQLRPAGQWNHSRIVVTGPRLEHVLNGTRVLQVDLESDAFESRVRGSTFADMPGFARHRQGHVALQHSSVSPLKAPVWFRNVRIRDATR